MAYEGSYGLFLQAKQASGGGQAGLRALVEGFLGAGVRGEGALYFQIVIQAVTLERVPKRVAKLSERYLPLYSAVLEEIVAADAAAGGIEAGDRKGAGPRPGPERTTESSGPRECRQTRVEGHGINPRVHRGMFSLCIQSRVSKFVSNSCSKGVSAHISP